MDKEDIIYYLKNSTLVRGLCQPWERYKRKKDYKEYQQSGNPEVIRTYKDSHKFESCVIVGNGPSLSIQDLDKISAKGIYCFATNNIFKLFSKTVWRPDMYLSIDKEVIKNIKSEIEEGNISNVWLDFEVRNAMSNKFNYFYNKVDFKLKKYCTDVIEFSEEPDKYMGFGYTVTFTALQMAIYMGFTNIYLIGMDHTVSHVVTSDGRLLVDNRVQNHFEKEKFHMYQAQYKEGLEYAYLLAKKCAEKKGINIYNATRGGKLEIFDRVSLDSILAERD